MASTCARAAPKGKAATRRASAVVVVSRRVDMISADEGARSGARPVANSVCSRARSLPRSPARGGRSGEGRFLCCSYCCGRDGAVAIAPAVTLGAAAAGAVADAVGETVPLIAAFCRLPIVCLAARVAARFTTAPATVAAAGVCRDGGTIPKSASVLGDVLN